MSLENMISGSKEGEIKEAYVAFDGQVRSRDRVRDLAEVLTHEREVKAMLDLVPEMFPAGPGDPAIDRKFLEPAVGTGNFVEEILKRKLAYVDYVGSGSAKGFLFDVMRAVASIYAIDIDASNVETTKARIRHLVSSHIDTRMNTVMVPEGFWPSLEVVLGTNVVLGNALTDMDRMLWVDYRVSGSCRFRRSWSVAGSDEIVMRDPIGERGRVYYAKLHEAPAPVRVEREKEEVAA